MKEPNFTGLTAAYTSYAYVPLLVFEKIFFVIFQGELVKVFANEQIKIALGKFAHFTFFIFVCVK